MGAWERGWVGRLGGGLGTRLGGGLGTRLRNKHADQRSQTTSFQPSSYQIKCSPVWPAEGQAPGTHPHRSDCHDPAVSQRSLRSSLLGAGPQERCLSSPAGISSERDVSVHVSLFLQLQGPKVGSGCNRVSMTRDFLVK